MTLNFEETASDCAVGRLLYSTVNAHFEFRFGVLVRRDNEHAPDQHPRWAFEALMAEMHDLIPATPYWRRTRYRMSTTHGRYQIRSIMREFLYAKELGHQCMCGMKCQYPIVDGSRRAS